MSIHYVVLSSQRPQRGNEAFHVWMSPYRGLCWSQRPTKPEKMKKLIATEVSPSLD